MLPYKPEVLRAALSSVLSLKWLCSLFMHENSYAVLPSALRSYLRMQQIWFNGFCCVSLPFLLFFWKILWCLLFCLPWLWHLETRRSFWILSACKYYMQAGAVLGVRCEGRMPSLALCFLLAFGSTHQFSHKEKWKDYSRNYGVTDVCVWTSFNYGY